MTNQTLRELVDARLRGRSWESLGKHLGLSGATVRGWAAGRHPMPEFRADEIAAWLGYGTTEDEVLTAAELSRNRDRLPISPVGSTKYVSGVATRGADEHGGFTMDERREVAEIAALLAEAAQRLARLGVPPEERA